ncbi:hypothetical protein FHY56_06385 [Brucella gallinifaecis]|uniref:Uncharacterized protein n=1 Tax=Brucella gallinifaecis TaxID=215590 RepID=A0A502BPZ0_9HYPH|nr:hypothetical protein FHY56_06385 [Brucella gallinifaecis]
MPLVDFFFSLIIKNEEKEELFMYQGISTHWHKTPAKAQRSPHEATYVFFGIFLACLTVPAAIILWAIAQGIMAHF